MDGDRSRYGEAQAMSRAEGFSAKALSARLQLPLFYILHHHTLRLEHDEYSTRADGPLSQLACVGDTSQVRGKPLPSRSAPMLTEDLRAPADAHPPRETKWTTSKTSIPAHRPLQDPREDHCHRFRGLDDVCGRLCELLAVAAQRNALAAGHHWLKTHPSRSAMKQAIPPYQCFRTNGNSRLCLGRQRALEEVVSRV